VFDVVYDEEEAADWTKETQHKEGGGRGPAQWDAGCI